MVNLLRRLVLIYSSLFRSGCRFCHQVYSQGKPVAIGNWSTQERALSFFWLTCGKQSRRSTTSQSHCHRHRTFLPHFHQKPDWMCCFRLLILKPNCQKWTLLVAVQNVFRGRKWVPKYTVCLSKTLDLSLSAFWNWSDVFVCVTVEFTTWICES